MNVCKKILALLLTLMLLLSMAPAAMADTADGKGGIIEVEGTSGITYTVYLMYEIEAVQTGEDENKTMYKYKVATAWDDFAPENYLKVENGYAFWQKSSASETDAAAIAQLAKGYLKEKEIEPVGTVQVGSTLEVAKDGYYLLVPDNNTASGVVIVEKDETRTVKEKATIEGTPTVTKLVREDDGGRLSSVNTMDIGQVFDVEVEIRTTEGATNYILHDKIDKHLQICDVNGDPVKDSNFTSVFSLERDGNALTNAQHYTIDLEPEDGCTFHINYIMDSFSTPFTNEGRLQVKYRAKLTGDADSETDHVNEAWLTHTDADVPTVASKAITQTFSVIINKVDQDGDPLAGAEFMLKDAVGNYYKMVDGKVTWTTKDEADKISTQEVNETEDGKPVTYQRAVFNGVDAELLIVEECTVPAGYIGIGEITASTRDSGKEAQSEVTTGFTPGYGQNKSVTIQNNLGNVMPETGGMGTTVFYAFGALLVTAAVVLLVLKKRAI